MEVNVLGIIGGHALASVEQVGRLVALGRCSCSGRARTRVAGIGRAGRSRASRGVRRISLAVQ